MMKLPPNQTEKEVLKIIEEVVESLSHKFVFGYYDVDDLKQEGRILAMEAVARYDASKGASLRTFLHNHVKKRFINLKRDKYQRPAPKNISGEKLEKWLSKNRVKSSLIDAIDISEEGSDLQDSQSEKFINVVLNQEMYDLIDLHLPVEYRFDYRCMMEDVKIPKHRKNKVIELIKEILYEYREKEGSSE